MPFPRNDKDTPPRMEFKVSSGVLLKALASISGAIVNNPVIPILENFLFEIDNGLLTATASDLQTTMRTEVAVDATQNSSIAVPARILTETLKNLPEQPITFHIDKDTFAIEIISENGRYKLAGENAIDFPRVPAPSRTESLDIPATVLAKAINNTIFSTSTEDLRPAMTGVLFELHDTHMTFVATDGHRLVRYRRTDLASTTEHTLIIPRKALNLLKANLPTDESPVRFEYNSSNAFFMWHNTALVCRLIDERFPDYATAIPASNPNHMDIDRLELLNTLKRINIYSNKTTHQVRFKIDGEALQVSAEDLDFSNEASESLPCDYDGEPMEIGFNARFLIEMLNNLDSNRITVELMAPNRQGIILPKNKADNEDILMLVMPVMLNQYV